MTNDRCSCGFSIKELDEALHKTEGQIKTYTNNSTEEDWMVIDIDTDRIKMAMNTAKEACGMDIKSAKDAYNRLVGKLPDIITEQGRKTSLGIINRIHFEIYHSLDNCISK